jgi:hypothetical protein
MKAITTEATERSIPAEDALRLVIDTTPALIHTGRPDGYLDYFNRGWLEFLVCPWKRYAVGAGRMLFIPKM